MAIFLTRNRLFSRLARQFCISEDRLNDECVGPFVNMHDLAASLWLRTGLHNDVEIPRRQLLVGCERVLALKRPVVLQAQRAILSIRKSGSFNEEQMRQLEAVMSQDRSMALISDHIRGAQKSLTNDDLLKIYRQVIQDQWDEGYNKGKADLVEERNKIVDELALAKEKSAGEIAELKDQLASLDLIVAQERTRAARRASELIGDFNEWTHRLRRRCRVALVLSALVLLGVSIYKEVATVEALASPHPFDLRDHLPLLVAALVPLLVLFIDQCMKVFGMERPIDRFVVEPIARRKLRRMIKDRGLSVAELGASSMSLAIPNPLPRLTAG